LVAVVGGCLLLGSFLSPLVRRLLPVRGVLLLELWTWFGCALYLAWPNVYVLTASILPTSLAIPATNSVVHGYRIAMTPDRLLGRTQAAWSTVSLLIMPLGPLVAGVLLDNLPARVAIGCFALFGLVLAIWGTFSPSIRAAPSLDELDRLRG
jgi:MFS family permease